MQIAETMEKYWNAYNEHDLEALLSFYDEEVIIRFPTDPQPARGKEQLRHRWTMLFTKVIPDIREALLSTIIQGDLVACETIESGTVTIPSEIATQMNVPAVSQPYVIYVGSFFRFNAQGLIAEVHAYWDTSTFSQQIGIDITHVRAMQSRTN